MRPLFLLMVIAFAAPHPAQCSPSEWVYGIYADVAYIASDNDPENHLWNNKSTTYKLDRLEANMVTGYVRKETSASSRWGFALGLQTGVDTDGLVTSAPPPSYEPINNAEDWTALAPSYLSYLFPVGNGLSVDAGLLSGHIAYESYHSLYNPTYTRGYLTDNVPYFMWAVQASYSFNDRFTAKFIVLTGYNYLTNPNNDPSWGAQLRWEPTATLTVVENLYYGPDQSDTAIRYWRFLSDTYIEWQSEKFLLAGAFDFGNERQAWLPGTPYYQWMSGAVWAQINITHTWRLAVRPEFYWDPDGLMTGAQQTLRSVATTLEYRMRFLEYNDLSVRMEYRFDRSTGDDGGFYAGGDNHLVPEQNVFILGLAWSLEWGG